MQLIPLEMLRSGEQGYIADIDGQHAQVARLEELGLRQGARIRMIRPGSPCILDVENHRMTFRGEECAAILIDVGPVPDPTH